MTPIERLHDALLDGPLDAQQTAELRVLLADPEQRRAWRRLSALSGRLHEELGEVAVPLPPGRHRRRTPAWLGLPWLGAAAAAARALSAGWALLREAPTAPLTVDGPAAGRLSEGGLTVAGGVLGPGDPIPAGSLATAAGDGALILADGGRCAWRGPARFLVRAGPPQMRLDHGDLRVEAEQLPVGSDVGVTTADCEARAPGSRFRVLALSDRTCVAVEAGEAQVATSAGRIAIAAGQAATAVAGKIPAVHPLAPPARWAVDHADPDAPPPSGWLGRSVPGGIAAVADPEEAADDPRRLVRTPRSAPPGLAALHPGLTVRARISAARPGPVEVFLVCNDPLSGDFRGLLHGKAQLAGDGTAETVRLGLDRLVAAKAPGPLDASTSVSCVILQWLGDDLGSVVSSIALEP